MPIVASPWERLAFGLNLAPAPMLDFLGAQAFRVAVAALRLGVLTALERPRSSEELARALELDGNGLGQLLHALEAIGYVRLRGGRWSLTRSTRRWLPLLAEGTDFFANLVFEHWRDLETSIQSGRSMPQDYAHTANSAEARELLVGLRAFARTSVDTVLRVVALESTATHLLDLGGGHGLYAARSCRRHPELRATVFDAPEALVIAGETAAEEGVADRVELRAGDFMRDDIGGPYDAVFVFNVVHGYDEPRNRRLLANVRHALVPGGRIAILDQLSDARVGGRVAWATARLNGLNLFHARGGEARRAGELRQWLEDAGFERVRRRDLLRSPGSSLLVAAARA